MGSNSWFHEGPNCLGMGVGDSLGVCFEWEVGFVCSCPAAKTQVQRSSTFGVSKSRWAEEEASEAFFGESKSAIWVSFERESPGFSTQKVANVKITIMDDGSLVGLSDKVGNGDLVHYGDFVPGEVTFCFINRRFRPLQLGQMCRLDFWLFMVLAKMKI
jgi:hypothetical protein